MEGKLFSTLTCPNCSYQKNEKMPTDGCQFFYECENCKTVLRPNPGDCCVYCSFGTDEMPIGTGRMRIFQKKQIFLSFFVRNYKILRLIVG